MRSIHRVALAVLILITIAGSLAPSALAAEPAVTAKTAVVQGILDKYTAAGLPGAAMACWSPTLGWMRLAAGYANLESKSPMTPDHLQYLQSVSKTYMAVSILQLMENGRLTLDAPVSKYLGEPFTPFLESPDKVTIRMLLNHASGIPEYSEQPKYISQVLLHPLQPLTAEQMLAPIAGQPRRFAPGEGYAYTNTNYLLLALVADALTGDYDAYLEEHVLRPLELSHTLNRHTKSFLDRPDVVHSYWDVMQNGNPADISAMQKVNVISLAGDDGLVATPEDVVRFLKGLFEGRLLKKDSLSLMRQWKKDQKGNPRYGMGLSYNRIGELEVIGHGGGGIGAGCGLLYLPAANLYVFIATNTGVLIPNPLAEKAEAMRNEILTALLAPD